MRAVTWPSQRSWWSSSWCPGRSGQPSRGGYFVEVDEHVERVGEGGYGHVLGAVAGWVVDAADDACFRGSVPESSHVVGAQVQPAAGLTGLGQPGVDEVRRGIGGYGDAEVPVVKADRHGHVSLSVLLAEHAARRWPGTVFGLQAQDRLGRGGVRDADPVGPAGAGPALVGADGACPRVRVAGVAAFPGDAVFVVMDD